MKELTDDLKFRGILTPEQKNEIKRLFIKGITIAEISRLFKVTPKAIKYHTDTIKDINRTKTLYPRVKNLKQYNEAISKTEDIYTKRETNFGNKPKNKFNKVGKPMVKSYQDYLAESKARDKIRG